MDLSDDLLTVRVSGCFVREVCEREGIPLGGELCVLFYNYLAGYLSRMGGFKPRLQHAERGHTGCSYQVRLY
jgi:hypothetical protein